MKIKINKCSVSRYWYHDMIGDTFPLVDDKKYEVKESKDNANNCYIVIHSNQEHVVICDDCEVVA